MDAHTLAARFSAGPSLTGLRELLTDFEALLAVQPRASSATLEVYSAILSARVIPTFDLEHTDLFVRVFSTPSGLGSLVSRLNTAAQIEVPALVALLESVLSQPRIVAQLVAAAPREIQSLLVGSRLLAVAAAKRISSWIADTAAYTRWIAAQLLTMGSDDAFMVTLFDRAAKLGAPQELVQVFLNNDFPALRDVYSRLRVAQQRYILVHGMIPRLPDPPAQAARVLVDLGVDAPTFVDIAAHLPADLRGLRAAVVLARERKQLGAVVTSLAAEWSNPVFIDSAPLSQQQAVSQLLIAACASLSPASAADFAHSAELTAGVSAHLDSTSPSIRRLGTLVAETFAKQAGAKLEFGLDYSDNDWWIGIDTIDSARDPPPKTAANLPVLQRIIEPATSREPEVADSDDELGTGNRDADSDDSEPEEVPPPFYIKDLVAYLQSDKYEEVHSALSTGARLVLRKAAFGTEVPHYATQLLRLAVSLNDKFSITRFSEMRQDLLNAVVVADPAQARTVVHLFATGDWSLAQRQTLLATLVHAAHTLAAGFTAPEAARLPGPVHAVFSSPYDTGASSLLPRRRGGTVAAPPWPGTDVGGVVDGAVGNSTMAAVDAAASGLADLAIADSGKVVRRSRRLDGGAKKHERKNVFSAVSDQFFFPLFASPPPLRPSSYDTLVYAQWLRTLAAIVVEAYPSHHMPAFVDELWPLLRGLAMQNLREAVMKEALCTSIIQVCDVAAGLVIQRYPSDVGAVLDAVLAQLEALDSGSMTRRLALSAASKLADLARAIQAQLTGEANSESPL